MNDNTIGPEKLSTRCIVCDEKIELENGQSEFVPRMCNECKEAVMFAKEMKEMCKQKTVDNIHDSERLIGVKLGFCPECGTILSNEADDITRFCNSCGQAVKWE